LEIRKTIMAIMRVMTSCVKRYASPLTVSLTQRRQFSVSTSGLLQRHFTEKHEWVMINGNIGTVGVSHHAQEALGDVVYVQPPEVGADIEQGSECGAVESVKAASEIYSPVSGSVIEVNTALEDKPGLINSSCYENGWIFKLQLKNPDEIKSLMHEKAYHEFLKTADH